MLDQETINRLEDRYEGNLDELLEILQITIPEIAHAFAKRIVQLRDELDIDFNSEEEDEHTS